MARRKKRTFVVPTWRVDSVPQFRTEEGERLVVELEALVRTVRLYNDALPVSDVEVVVYRDCVRIDVYIEVPMRQDLDHVAPMVVIRSAAVPWAPILDNGAWQVINVMRTAFHGILAHEVDENLIVDGSRAYDPHRRHHGL